MEREFIDFLKTSAFDDKFSIPQASLAVKLQNEVKKENHDRVSLNFTERKEEFRESFTVN
jgi:hypothetical protein